MLQRNLIITLCLFVMLSFIVCQAQKMLVCTPVANLLSNPIPVPDGLQAPALSQDTKGLISQVLFGEKLVLNEKYFAQWMAGNWVNVFAVEQEIISRDKEWSGCPGYVDKSHIVGVEHFPNYNIVLQDLWTPIYAQKDDSAAPLISCALGTMLEAKKIDNAWWQVYFCDQPYGFIKATSSIYELSDKVQETDVELRNTIINIAKKFIGCLYLLGGRSPTKQPQDPHQITGIDCSDFINVLFKAVGLQIPKNSNSQFHALPKVIQHGKDLLPGDLIFFTKKTDLNRMRHVMLYLGKNENGDDEVIEAAGLGLSSIQEAIDNNIDHQDLVVRKIKLVDYIGVTIDQLEAGKTIYEKNGAFVLMGSFLPSPEAIQTLRTKLISL